MNSESLLTKPLSEDCFVCVRPNLVAFTAAKFCRKQLILHELFSKMIQTQCWSVEKSSLTVYNCSKLVTFVKPCEKCPLVVSAGYLSSFLSGSL